MKTTTLFISIFFAFFLSFASLAQVSVPANAGVPANYVGWNITQPFPLRIEHKGNQPIGIGTNGFFRMAVANGPGTINGGRVGFGNNIPAAFIPQDRLHSFVTTAGDNMFRFSNTGFAANQGFRLGLNLQNIALFDKLEAGIFRFDMQNLTVPTGPRSTKFTIGNINQTNVTTTFQPQYLNTTRVGIWSQAGPANGSGTLAMLHLGVPGTQNTIAHRDWMNMGTYMNEGGDAMYVGLRQVGSNVTDAILAWGDDGNDRFKIVFNSQLNIFPGNPSSSNGGLEVARFITNTGADGLVLFNIDPSSPNLDPQNTVHIVGQSTAGTAATLGGNSGLRFQLLNSTTPPIVNPGPGVLAVDAAGDVIYVQSSSVASGGPGGLCSSPPNPLAGDYNIPLNLNHFYFSGDNALVDKVYFGYNCGNITQPGKVNATTSFPTQTSTLYPASITSYANNAFNTIGGTGVGFFGESNSSVFAAASMGVWGRASGFRNAVGVFGEAINVIGGPAYGGSFQSLSNGNSVNAGVRAEGANAGDNYGSINLASGGLTSTAGYFYASGAAFYNIGVTAIGQNSLSTPPQNTYTGFFPQANIGIYATGEPSNSSIGFLGPDWAGWFDGDVYINGSAYYSGFLLISDRKFKTNVQTISSAADIVAKLNPTTYHFIDGKAQGMKFSTQKQYGFISQEVEAVLPDLIEDVHKPAMVNKDGSVQIPAVDYKAINYVGFIALLTKAMQEQQTEIQDQEDRLLALEQQIDELKNILITSNLMPSGDKNQQVTLSDSDEIKLFQNVPNPFNESTLIRYDIPVEFGQAHISFGTIDGRVIRTVSISGSGSGQIEVMAGDLSSGIYTYTLVVDGRVIATHKLLKSK